MATADTVSASIGPRYAPEDPTLPKPWKGLIDGSTGVQYYWNPETNVTQYERPASNAPPPLPLSTPPATPAVPDLAPASFTPAAPQSNAGPVQHQYQPPMQMHQYPAMQTAHQQQQTPHIQMQHMQYQQTLVAQQSIQQGPMPVQQVLPVVLHQGKQGGHSSSQIQNGGMHSGQTPQVKLHSFSGKQTTGGFINSPENGSSVTQLQVGGNDGMQRQQLGPHVAHSHSGHSMVHNLQGGSLGLQMGYNQNQLAGNELLYNNNSARLDEGRTMVPQQPLLAPIPRVQNQQDVRMPAVHIQNGPPGHPIGMNVAAGNPMLNLYNQPSVRPSQNFSPNAPAWPSPRVAGSSDLLNPSAADAYRRQHEVTAMGDNVPAPFMTFEATGFPPEILKEIHLAGFTSPTPIQAQTWPIALQSRDIVAIAKTGSGKTLGYIIPAFIHLRRSQYNRQMGPVVVVLAPTRELATQIQDEVVKFGRSSRISCTCLYGGAPKGPQLSDIERGVDIIVATPGRLNDILEMRKINFGQVSFLVLDEADRMLDMGFEPQIRKIVNEIPPRRQTLMYTATWPKEVRKIAGDLLVNPVQVNIGSVDELEANKSITQYVEMVSPMEKQQRLEQILRAQERGSKVIIFCATKKLCDQLARSIGRNFGAAAIHGDKSQGERDWVLNQFRSGRAPILVATDVAARGLDIKDIRVVINYDFPTGVEDYVHRIGRTGRAGATGVAYTFFSEQDWKYAADLVKVLEGANQRVPPEVRDMAARGGQGYKDRSGMNRWDSSGGAPWESKGRGGMRDNGYGGGRGGGRDNRYGGRGGGRDNGYGGRGGGRDNGYGGRGGGRDNGFGGRGGGRENGFAGGRGSRNDFAGGRGIRGRGFGGPGGWGRNDRQDRLDGQGRFEYRRGGYRSRSRSPYRGRSRGYNRSRSSSRSRSRSRSWTRSRSRSWSRGRSRSGSRGPTRSRTHSDDRPERSAPRRTETAPVKESPILPQPEVPHSLQSTADVFDGPPPVSQISPSTEGCQINSTLSSSDPVQKQSHEPMCQDLDPVEKPATDA